MFRFEVGFVGIDGVGTSKLGGRAGELTAALKAESFSEVEVSESSQDGGKRLGSLQIHSGFSCSVLMLDCSAPSGVPAALTCCLRGSALLGYLSLFRKQTEPGLRA